MWLADGIHDFLAFYYSKCHQYNFCGCCTPFTVNIIVSSTTLVREDKCGTNHLHMSTIKIKHYFVLLLSWRFSDVS